MINVSLLKTVFPPKDKNPTDMIKANIPIDKPNALPTTWLKRPIVLFSNSVKNLGALKWAM